MNRPPQARGIGCAAIFFSMCLSLFLTVEVCIIWWLNPHWFDQLAFWRGPILEPDLIVEQDPKSREQRKREFDAAHAPLPKPKPENPRTLEAASVTGEFTPGQEMTLKNPAGAELKLSANAVGEAAKVRMTPVMSLSQEMAQPLAGPVYDIRIGTHEHYEFRDSVTLTLPYRPEFREDQPTIAVWEGDKWKMLPSQLDANANTVTATVPHVSFVGVLGKAWRFLNAPLTAGRIVGFGSTGAALTIFVATDPTMRGNARAGVWYFTGGNNKQTENFVIHYMTTGDHAVVGDNGYVLRGKRKPSDHPLFVEDVAQYLEEARTRLEKLGLPLPKPRLLRHDVFLLKLDDDASELGNSDLGGPVILSTLLPQAARATADKVRPEGVIRATVAHELTHVAQGEHFGVVSGYQRRWWIEATAEYMGDRCWMPENDYDQIRKVTLDFLPDGGEKFLANRLPSFSFDETKGARVYAHALFFHWLDARRGKDSALGLISNVNQDSASLEGIDQVANRRHGTSLADLFADYAADFYYRDQWHGTLTPAPHRGLTPRQQMLAQQARTNGADSNITYTDQTFVALTGNGERNDEAWTYLSAFPHLSARACYVHAGTWLPEARKGKLILSMEGDGSPNLRFSYALDKLGDGPLPLSGSPSSLITQKLEKDSPIVIENFATRGGHNRATFLFVNTSLSERIPGFGLRRWILLAPSWVLAARESAAGAPLSRNWMIAWHRSELRDTPDIFKGYNVYRRKVAESPPNWMLVKEEVQEEKYTDTAPDDTEYIFGIRVKDKVGNLSEIKEQDNNDPWVGVWEGEVRLIEGSVVVPLKKGLAKSNAESDRKEQERIAQEQNPAERTRRTQTLEKHKAERADLQKLILDLLELAEQAARLGVPIQAKIRQSEGHYYLGFTEILWNDTGWKPADDIELIRVDENTLKFKTVPPEFPPLYLRLHRATPGGRHEQRGEWSFIVPEDTDRNRFRINWSLLRK